MTTKDEALKLALEALESFAPHNGVFWRNLHKDDAEIDNAITAIKQALAAPVQEPVAWMHEVMFGIGNKGRVLSSSSEHPYADDERVEYSKAKVVSHPLYTTPPAAQRQWTPMSKELLSSQVHWLYKQMWIAMKDGSIMSGVYEWRQGWDPDRLLLDGAGDVWAYEAEYVMPIVQPEHPNKLKEKNT